MNDSLILEVHDLVVNVLTGIYSQETHLPQPLRISISTTLDMAPHYVPDTPLSASKNYMTLKEAATKLPEGVHFTLIEAVADHIMDTLLPTTRASATSLSKSLSWRLPRIMRRLA